VVFAQPRGFFDRDITPELVRDNWNSVMGDVDPDDSLHGFQEVVSLEREFQMLVAAGVGAVQV
jgi:hypothetical protein